MSAARHTAPSLNADLGCAVVPFGHLEYFLDHVRLEAMLFDGALTQADGPTPLPMKTGKAFLAGGVGDCVMSVTMPGRARRDAATHTAT